MVAMAAMSTLSGERAPGTDESLDCIGTETGGLV
jgi:hypothetical protein